MRYTICQWAINRFRPSELTKHHPRCSLTLQVQVNKENLIEFPLLPVHYLYNYYMVCALLSHIHHVTCHVTVTMWHLWYDTFLYSFLYSKEKRKRKEKNINSNLAVLPSHDKRLQSNNSSEFINLTMNKFCQ